MTNAEKFQEIFKKFATEVWAFPEKDFLTWLNAEYEEPTTKNDLGVDCISRKAAEDITWQDPSYTDPLNILTEVRDKIRELPSVTPQLSVPEVTALAEWTEKLTKASEDAYNKGYEAGMKAQEPRKGHWIVQPSNKEQGERDFIWWKCSKCGQVIFSETEKDRKEFHAFCGRCGADMREVKE